jgi:hypothetical protein
MSVKINDLSASQAIFTDANKILISNANLTAANAILLTTATIADSLHHHAGLWTSNNSAQVIYVDTNSLVGIGVASPAIKFHIKGVGGIGITQLYVEGKRGGYGAGVSFLCEQGFGSYVLTPQAKIVADGTGNWLSDAQTSSKLTFWTTISNSLTEKMAILATGYTGIGVTDPDTMLEVLYAGDQLKLSYDGTDNCIFAADTNGDLTITPSGSHVIVASGKDLRLGNSYHAGAPTASGYILIEDSTGTQYKIPAVAA